MKWTSGPVIALYVAFCVWALMAMSEAPASPLVQGSMSAVGLAWGVGLWIGMVAGRDSKKFRK